MKRTHQFLGTHQTLDLWLSQLHLEGLTTRTTIITSRSGRYTASTAEVDLTQAEAAVVDRLWKIGEWDKRLIRSIKKTTKAA